MLTSTYELAICFVSTPNLLVSRADSDGRCINSTPSLEASNTLGILGLQISLQQLHQLILIYSSAAIWYPILCLVLFQMIKTLCFCCFL